MEFNYDFKFKESYDLTKDNLNSGENNNKNQYKQERRDSFEDINFIFETNKEKEKLTDVSSNSDDSEDAQITQEEIKTCFNKEILKCIFEDNEVDKDLDKKNKKVKNSLVNDKNKYILK